MEVGEKGKGWGKKVLEGREERRRGRQGAKCSVTSGPNKRSGQIAGEVVSRQEAPNEKKIKKKNQTRSEHRKNNF